MKILLYTFYKRWGLCSRVVWEVCQNKLSLREVKRRSIPKIRDATPTKLACNDIDHYFINGLRGVGGLLKRIVSENYDLVIGLGDYRKDAKNIRIETKFVNKYGRNKILEKGKELYNADVNFVVTGLNKPHPAPLLFGEGTVILSNKMSNGPCNRSAYLVSELIERKMLKTKLLFLHVPRCMELVEVKTFLLEMIDFVVTDQ